MESEKNLKFVYNNTKPVLSKRFLLSWIFSSLLMFGISYSWHGIFLNDVRNLNYPISIYLISSSIIYLLTGFALVKFFSHLFIIQMFRNFIVRGLVCGASLGLVMYMAALVLGISFTKNTSMSSILIDVPWQIFEQAMGGLLIGTFFSFIYEPVPLNRSRDHV
jgi:hypothetical protein